MSSPTTTALLTLEEVARQLRTSPQWVRVRIWRHELATHRVKGRTRISQADLNDYLRRARQDLLRPWKKTRGSKESKFSERRAQTNFNP
jgi:excisionase family DNA binding protein